MSDDVDVQRTNVSDEMQAAVGTEISRRVSFPVSESDIRRWAVAVYYPEPPPLRFIDAGAAAASAAGGIVAPEDFNPFAWVVAETHGAEMSGGAANNPDMFEQALGISGPGLPNILNGGIEIEYGVPIRPGDIITSVTALDGYRERPGSLGLMLFTMMRTVWTNQDGQTVKSVRGTTIRY